MIPNVKPSQVYPNLGQISPQSIAAAANATTGATYLTVPVGAKWLHIRLLCGALGGGSEQVDVLQATAAAGTGSKSLASNVITNNTNNTASYAEVSLDSLDVANGYAFVQVKVTNTGGTGALVAADVSAGPNAYAV